MSPTSHNIRKNHNHVVQTWKYKKCEIDDFEIFYDYGLLVCKMHQKWQSEFRDKSIFGCVPVCLLLSKK